MSYTYSLLSSAKPLDHCAPSHYLRILPTFSIPYNTFQGSGKATPNFWIVGKGIKNLEWIGKDGNLGAWFVDGRPEINSLGRAIQDLLTHCERKKNALQWYVYPAEYMYTQQNIRAPYESSKDP
jgi:hypothetical protein